MSNNILGESDDSSPDSITDKIYIGNLANATNKIKLKEIGITHILICASYIEPNFPQDFIYKHIDVDDLPNFDINIYFEECNIFIKDAIRNGKILIHCAAGLSRSPTFAIAFLMKENKWHFEESLFFVKSKKPSINPNFGFKTQLKLYESIIFNSPDYI